MAGLAPVELTADCSHCGLEGGVVEVYDALVAACRFGLPATTRCKLCSAASHATFNRAPAKALRETGANRCPACLEELSPSAIDERRCARCGASAALESTAAPGASRPALTSSARSTPGPPVRGFPHARHSSERCSSSATRRTSFAQSSGTSRSSSSPTRSQTWACGQPAAGAPGARRGAPRRRPHGRACSAPLHTPPQAGRHRCPSHQR